MAVRQRTLCTVLASGEDVVIFSLLDSLHRVVMVERMVPDEL